MRNRIFSAVTGIVLAILLIALMEGGSRLLYRVRHGAWPVSLAKAVHVARTQSRRLFVSHSILPFTLRPNVREPFMDTVVEVNGSGYRGPALRRDSLLRVLVLGGSTAFDTCVSDEAHTWVRQVEGLLQDDMPGLEMINGGLPMYGLADNAIKYLLYDAHLKPDVVLIYQGLNDLLGGVAKELAPLRQLDFWEFRGRMNRAWAGLHEASPLETGQSAKEESLSLIAHSVFLNGALNERGANPNIFADLVSPSRPEGFAPDGLLAKNGQLLRALVLTIRNNGALPVFVPQSYGDTQRAKAAGRPLAALGTALGKLNRYYASVCRELSVPVVDTTRVTDTFGDEKFSGAVHFNDNGAASFAQLLAKSLAENPEMHERYTREKANAHDRPSESQYMISLEGEPASTMSGDVSLEMALSKSDGFDPPEGPYDHWKLPRVRWMNNLAARIAVTTGDTGKWVFLMTVMTHAQKQELRVRIDGEELIRHAFAAEGVFVDLQSPAMELAPGNHIIELEASSAREENGRQMALLFSRMAFEQAPGH